MLKNWELMHVLLVVARSGTLRQAATVLPYTQPTLGKKITQLERDFDAKLFYRTKAGMTLTPAGERLVLMAEEMERMVNRASVHIEKRDALSGKLRLAMSDGMAGYWLAPRLRRYHRDHPYVTLDVQILDSGGVADLSRREADITVMYAYPSDPDVVVLQKSNLILAPTCTRGFVEDWGVPNSIEDVLRFPVCAHTMHYRKEGNMRLWAEMLERHPMVIYRTGSSMVLGNVVRMGIGLSLQPLGVVEREGDDAVTLDLGYRSELPFYLVCHKDVKDVPEVREMLRYLTNALFRDDGLGSPAKGADLVSG
ncbi:MAG: LysR family transcriptional regulator [Rhodospirillaceae bacterium]|nr:LysR family transcriptional regulator [Rhodospirillales bacterium]